MGKVIFTEKADNKLEQLVYKLYRKGYFGFMDSAIEYIRGLREFADAIPGQTKRLCKNTRYGKWYCRYKPNRNTTWYFTFDTDGKYFVIRNVLNNHTREYPTYITGLK